jgi:hypothetical protein
VIESIASGAIVADRSSWDPAAFAEAVRAHLSTGGALAESAVLWGDRVPQHERDLRGRQLGVPGLAALASTLGL